MFTTYPSKDFDIMHMLNQKMNGGTPLPRAKLIQTRVTIDDNPNYLDMEAGPQIRFYNSTENNMFVELNKPQPTYCSKESS